MRYRYPGSGPTDKGLLTIEHRRHLKGLQASEEIVVSQPDRGADIVLAKMNPISNDRSKLTKLPNEKDDTVQIEKSVSKRP